MERTLLQQH